MLRSARPTFPRWFGPVALAIVVAMLVGGCSRSPRKSAIAVSTEDRAVLTQYEAVRAALADDDSRRTRLAGEKLLKAIEAPGVSPAVAKTKIAAKTLAESFRIDVSRAAFKEISAALIPICDGAEGFLVLSSSLVPDGSWIQTTPAVSNPYLGRAMATYGEIKP